jgi:hypothetical protein
MWLLAVLGATAAMVAPAAPPTIAGSWVRSAQPRAGAQPLPAIFGPWARSGSRHARVQPQCFTDQPGKCVRVCTLFIAESRGPGACPNQEVRARFHFIGPARPARPGAARHLRRVPASPAATAP